MSLISQLLIYFPNEAYIQNFAVAKTDIYVSSRKPHSYIQIHNHPYMHVIRIPEPNVTLF